MPRANTAAAPLSSSPCPSWPEATGQTKSENKKNNNHTNTPIIMNATDEKLNLLLCEDDENLGMLLREYLQAKGFETDLCADGEAGYRSFLKNPYDICVLDV